MAEVQGTVVYETSEGRFAIPYEERKAFLKDFPSAQEVQGVSIFSTPDGKFAIPDADTTAFRADYPDAKLVSQKAVPHESLTQTLKEVFQPKEETVVSALAKQVTEGGAIGSPTDPILQSQALMNVLDIPQDVAVAALANTDKEGKPLGDFTEKLAQGLNPSDVIDVGDNPLVLPQVGPSAPIGRETKEAGLDIALDPLNIPAGLLGKAVANALKLGKFQKFLKALKIGKVSAKEVKVLKEEVKRLLPPAYTTRSIRDRDIVDIAKGLEVVKTKEGVYVAKGNVPKQLPEGKTVFAEGKGIEKGRQALKEKPKVKVKKTKQKVAEVEIPTLKNSDEGTAFGLRHQGNKKVIVGLKKKHAEISKEMQKLKSEKKYQEAMNLSLKKQSTREAIEAAEKSGSFSSYEKNILQGQRIKSGSVTGEIVEDMGSRLKIKSDKGNIVTVPKDNVEILSGKDYGKGLFKAVKDDIKDTLKGDPTKLKTGIEPRYDNIKKFLKENRLKLTDEEVAQIHNFAKKQGKRLTASSFDEFLNKNFPKLTKERPKGFEPMNSTEAKGEASTINLFDQEVPLKKESFNLDVHRKVVDAVEKTMIEKGIKRDKVAYPNLSDQMLYDVWQKGKISFKDVKKYGVTEKEFTSMWRDEITDAARRLAALSHSQRRLTKEMEDIGKEFKVLDKKIEPDWMAKVGNILRRMDNIRRGLMVSQISTAVRNAFSQAGRIGLDVFDEGVEVALGKMLKLPQYERASFKDAFQLFGRLTKKNKDILENVMASSPKEYNRMFMHYASDVLEGTGIGGKLGKVEEVVQYLNWANRLQEFGIRRAAFVGKLNTLLDRKGIDFYSIVKRGEDFTQDMIRKYGTEWKSKISSRESAAFRSIMDIPEDDIKKSVDFALEVTFADTPKSKPARAILNAINSMPFVGTGPFPFARFLMNAVRFNFEHSPLGFVRLLKPGTNKLEVISRAATGSMLLYTGYELRKSKHAGEKWYELKVGDETYDTRAYNPFAAYLFMGDVINKIETGTLNNMTFKEFISGVASSNLRAGVGLWTVDKLIQAIEDATAWEDFKKSMAEYAGGVVSGYAQWFNQFNELLAEFNPEYAKARQSKGFWDQIKKKIPGFYSELKEVESPTRKAVPKKQDPLLKALTGLMRIETKNLLESELDRLGFKYSQIYPRVKDDTVDYLTKREMGILAEENVIPFLLSDTYRKNVKDKTKISSDAQRRFMLNKLLQIVRQAAKLRAIGKYDEARQIEIRLRKEFRNKSTIEREFLKELTQ